MAKSKTTCRVLFEDYRGDAHRVTVRVPYSARITNSNIAKLAAQKSGHRVSLIVGMECADRSVGKHPNVRTFLPHKRRR